MEKYIDKEIVATIKVVQDILNTEEFNLKVSCENSNTSELKFQVKNFEGLANLGDIESETFDNLGILMDRLIIYHNDYFHEADCDKKYDELGNEIVDEQSRKYLMFLESNYCIRLLYEITPDVYNEYINTTKGKEIMNNFKEDALSYLINKDIATKIIDTQSAYVMVEQDNKIYLSYYGFGDGSFIDDEGKKWDKCEALLSIVNDNFQVYNENGDNELFTAYNSYKDVIDTQINQVIDDINDLGVAEHYLSRYEFEYLGLGDEYRQAVDKNGNMSMEELQELLNDTMTLKELAAEDDEPDMCDEV